MPQVGFPCDTSARFEGRKRRHDRHLPLASRLLLTGSEILSFDPIFQGLALSLMAGEVASTVLSRMAVPVLYYLSQKRARG